MTDSIKIAVRVRPFNDKEKMQGTSNIVEMNGQEVRLREPSTGQIRKFGFHRCYYSTDEAMGHPPVDNEFLFNDVGKEVLNNIYQGYNSTIFAYGQTGSGKSYSIQGYEQKGILQMCLQDIFNRKKPQNNKNGKITAVKITYMQIYNEKLRDLINPSDKEIKVQQNGTVININGVEPAVCQTYEKVLKLFQDGKKMRVVGAHAMNKNSSRSHAVFTIYYKETGGGKMIESKFNIVDLAGSERQSKTGATGQRLEEANNINKSLTNLGIVIEQLALNCQKKATNFVPYRNSMLTHILSESLCGNSKTFMIAAISPADSNYQQTLGTLRFAQRASMITTKTTKNVQAKAGYNKQLLQQIQKLKKELQGAKGTVIHTHSVSVEYITIEREASEMDSRITQMKQQLAEKENQKNSLQYQLNALQDQKKNLDIQRNKKKILDPEQQKRAKEIDGQMGELKKNIQNSKSQKERLQKELQEEKKKRQELQANIKAMTGQRSEQQKKSDELNARIQIMMSELNKNKFDKQALAKELEEQRKKKQQMEENREKMLKEAGLSGNNDVNERKFPYIMNVSEDPTLLGMLIYDIKEGSTQIGTKDAEENQIKLNALGIMTRHCIISNEKGKIFMEAQPEAKVFVNGSLITKKIQLHHLDRIGLGHSNNFKLVIPGKGSLDDLRNSIGNVGKYGQYIDDKVNQNTIQAKSMKLFLGELSQRLEKHLFANFLQKFKGFLQDVDEANDMTFHRYKKFPLKSKNVFFRVNAVIDVQNYMKGVPQLIILCEQKGNKQVLFVWTEQKFLDRIAAMQDWYEDVDKGDDIHSSYYEFDPWFDASDAFIREKELLQNFKTKDLVQHWNKKQILNSQQYKKTLQEQKEILASMKAQGFNDIIVEDYADFYFRGFPVAEGSKKKIQQMRKDQKVHVVIQRFMQCCAEVQKCSIDNKYYNEQKQKYGSKKAATSNEGGKSDEALLQENVWLNQKMQELQEELKRKTQIINKLRKAS